MHTKEMNTGTSGGTLFVAGLVCGAAVGALAGLLFAPKSGAELRQDIAETTGRVRDKMRDVTGTATDAFNEAVDRGRKGFREGREAASRVAEN